MTTVQSGGPQSTVDDAGDAVTGTQITMQSVNHDLLLQNRNLKTCHAKSALVFSAVGGVPQSSVIPPSVAHALPAVYLTPMNNYWFGRYLDFLSGQN